MIDPESDMRDPCLSVASWRSAKTQIAYGIESPYFVANTKQPRHAMSPYDVMSATCRLLSNFTHHGRFPMEFVPLYRQVAKLLSLELISRVSPNDDLFTRFMTRESNVFTVGPTPPTGSISLVLQYLELRELTCCSYCDTGLSTTLSRY